MFNTKKIIFIVLALIAMLSMIYLTPEMAGLNFKAKVALGVGIFAIIVWITQALDDAQSGFLIITFLVLFGAGKMSEALIGYSSTGVWIVVLGMIMAACMGDTGLSKRLALIIVSKIGKSAINLYWAISLVTLLMTFFIPSLAAKTLLVIPIITSRWV